MIYRPKVKVKLLVSDEDEQDCICAVNLQRREGLSFSSMISIFILGLNLKDFAMNQVLKPLEKLVFKVSRLGDKDKL